MSPAWGEPLWTGGMEASPEPQVLGLHTLARRIARLGFALRPLPALVIMSWWWAWRGEQMFLFRSALNVDLQHC